MSTNPNQIVALTLTNVDGTLINCKRRVPSHGVLSACREIAARHQGKISELTAAMAFPPQAYDKDGKPIEDPIGSIRFSAENLEAVKRNDVLSANINNQRDLCAIELAREIINTDGMNDQARAAVSSDPEAPETWPIRAISDDGSATRVNFWFEQDMEKLHEWVDSFRKRNSI